MGSVSVGCHHRLVDVGYECNIARRCVCVYTYIYVYVCDFYVHAPIHAHKYTYMYGDPPWIHRLAVPFWKRAEILSNLPPSSPLPEEIQLNLFQGAKNQEPTFPNKNVENLSSCCMGGDLV